MDLAKIIVVGLGVVGATAYVLWQIYKRRQLASYRNYRVVDNKPVYFTPDSDGTVVEAECAICLEVMTIVHRAHRLPCGHTFHERCIQMWARYDTTCPLCRRPFEVTSF
ncbi:E3 ubiquitin-protein ligase AMFR-like [Watersipora subatra]|uniref:E3 ubiquitin-protein ligase AMFR-like n=1 Tax=Watersipora subatra TaxID=2589382 RepID=UPI00355AD70B